jgi:hypothetical protein
MAQDLRLADGQETIIHQGDSTVVLHGGGDITVKLGTASVDVHTDGRIEAHTANDVDAYTDRAVHVHHAANDRNQPNAAAEPRVGDRMPDGTIYAGISPDTHQPMYATEADAPLTMKWKQAMDYAARLDAYGHRDWRVPSQGELNVLFNNHAAIGGFNESGEYPAGRYWSSSHGYYDGAWDQRFSDGYHDYRGKDVVSSLRCVRGVSY